MEQTAMATGRFVAYYRVSTDRQGRLEAQRKAVADYLNGGRWTLAAEFTEIESGKSDARPKLAEALALCRAYNATLVIAKLDRLSRDAHFLLGLQKAKVRFVAADMPEANETLVGIMAVIAQAERKMIADRTRAALAAAKARGAKLGGKRKNSRTIHRAGVPKSIAARKAKAADFASNLAPVIASVREEGATTMRAIADALNERGVPTPRGGVWGPSQVQRIITRLSA
jgi:DNA invertase Pin-like site-specific DNA recombinase